MVKNNMEDIYLINKISNRLKELSKFTEQKEVQLEEVADKLSDLLMYIEDNIDIYRREKCKSIKTKIKSYPIGR
jgi:hypothetical protein